MSGYIYRSIRTFALEPRRLLQIGERTIQLRESGWDLGDVTAAAAADPFFNDVYSDFYTEDDLSDDVNFSDEIVDDVYDKIRFMICFITLFPAGILMEKWTRRPWLHLKRSCPVKILNKNLRTYRNNN